MAWFSGLHVSLLEGKLGCYSYQLQLKGNVNGYSPDVSLQVGATFQDMTTTTTTTTTAATTTTTTITNNSNSNSNNNNNNRVYDMHGMERNWTSPYNSFKLILSSNIKPSNFLTCECGDVAFKQVPISHERSTIPSAYSGSFHTI